MKKKYILVIDSGVGGVSILKELIKNLPHESFIYLADNRYSPYGNKNKRFLQKNIIKIINEYMLKYSIKLIIFACNTLTATTIEYVRKHINCKIIGTEPPVKKIKNNKKSLVLLTKSTLKYSILLKRYKNNKNYHFVALSNVASILDKNFFNREYVLAELKKQIPVDKYKYIVLGCTHYYFLKKEIKSLFNYRNLVFYDALDGVVKQTLTMLDKNNIVSKQSIKIHTTKPNSELKKTIKIILNN